MHAAQPRRRRPLELTKPLSLLGRIGSAAFPNFGCASLCHRRARMRFLRGVQGQESHLVGQSFFGGVRKGWVGPTHGGSAAVRPRRYGSPRSVRRVKEGHAHIQATHEVDQHA